VCCGVLFDSFFRPNSYGPPGPLLFVVALCPNEVILSPDFQRRRSLDFLHGEMNHVTLLSIFWLFSSLMLSPPPAPKKELPERSLFFTHFCQLPVIFS